jgi:CRISPR-associated protein Csb2
VTHLTVTVRFLDDRYHGLMDRGGPPEWPPSPFRLFQALVAGVARRVELVIGPDTPENTNFTDIGNALRWLQRHTRKHPPIIIAPKSTPGQAITRFVPNNDGDKNFDRQDRLTAKLTIPTLFLLDADQKPEVHYVWDVTGTADIPEKHIRSAARALTSLGLGIDMAFADAWVSSDADVCDLKGVRWHPKQSAGVFGNTLRTPTYDDELGECTLRDLRHCHQTAISRIEHGKPLKTVDKPKTFDRVLYTSTERPNGRPHAIFKLLDANEDAYRHPHATLIHIAGMVRHAAIERMLANPPRWIEDSGNWINRVVRGKRDESSADGHLQFSYVPLPSIGHQHADAMIRNVMIIAPLGMERELEYLAERLNGETLKPEENAGSCESDSRPLLSETINLRRFSPPAGRFIDTHYLGTSKTWHTVTPVILDGHNRKSKSDKPEAITRETEKLIRKALLRAGIETPCEFTWRPIPFLKNCLSAHKYDRNGRHTGYHRPAHLKNLTAVHVRLAFTHPVPGPLTIGAGRHCGFGLMAACDPDSGER